MGIYVHGTSNVIKCSCLGALKKNIVYNDGNGRVTQARGVEKKSIEYKYYRLPNISY